ncbi:hypothetical protein CC1G_04335 [Coprinopsis cinerea okayama7|uniref:Uncharacterized protein n=1 Tax=Coprinopsis cinerea (strain Okayama-7 / 130 / ATCC MYA-4618 / FGSC 9003) TaxID=240176 RepID=A8N0N2_COPC7|nr:hypothetical protein CC1G_04335 [Coprinopsis cinerea okayama7\|eukprot:XP_001828364.2 hypothetical protein CC1G_04335 [Coprinopsis cinerea okayama7\
MHSPDLSYLQSVPPPETIPLRPCCPNCEEVTNSYLRTTLLNYPQPPEHRGSKCPPAPLIGGSAGDDKDTEKEKGNNEKGKDKEKHHCKTGEWCEKWSRGATKRVIQQRRRRSSSVSTFTGLTISPNTTSSSSQGTLGVQTSGEGGAISPTAFGVSLEECEAGGEEMWSPTLGVPSPVTPTLAAVGQQASLGAAASLLGKDKPLPDVKIDQVDSPSPETSANQVATSFETEGASLDAASSMTSANANANNTAPDTEDSELETDLEASPLVAPLVPTAIAVDEVDKKIRLQRSMELGLVPKGLQGKTGGMVSSGTTATASASSSSTTPLEASSSVESLSQSEGENPAGGLKPSPSTTTTTTVLASSSRDTLQLPPRAMNAHERASSGDSSLSSSSLSSLSGSAASGSGSGSESESTTLPPSLSRSNPTSGTVTPVQPQFQQQQQQQRVSAPGSIRSVHSRGSTRSSHGHGQSPPGSITHGHASSQNQSPHASLRGSPRGSLRGSPHASGRSTPLKGCLKNASEGGGRILSDAEVELREARRALRRLKAAQQGLGGGSRPEEEGDSDSDDTGSGSGGRSGSGGGRGSGSKTRTGGRSSGSESEREREGKGRIVRGGRKFDMSTTGCDEVFEVGRRKRHSYHGFTASSSSSSPSSSYPSTDAAKWTTTRPPAVPLAINTRAANDLGRTGTISVPTTPTKGRGKGYVPTKIFTSHSYDAYTSPTRRAASDGDAPTLTRRGLIRRGSEADVDDDEDEDELLFPLPRSPAATPSPKPSGSGRNSRSGSARSSPVPPVPVVIEQGPIGGSGDEGQGEEKEGEEGDKGKGNEEGGDARVPFPDDSPRPQDSPSTASATPTAPVAEGSTPSAPAATTSSNTLQPPPLTDFKRTLHPSGHGRPPSRPGSRPGSSHSRTFSDPLVSRHFINNAINNASASTSSTSPANATSSGTPGAATASAAATVTSDGSLQVSDGSGPGKRERRASGGSIALASARLEAEALPPSFTAPSRRSPLLPFLSHSPLFSSSSSSSHSQSHSHASQSPASPPSAFARRGQHSGHGGSKKDKDRDGESGGNGGGKRKPSFSLRMKALKGVGVDVLKGVSSIGGAARM